MAIDIRPSLHALSDEYLSEVREKGLEHGLNLDSGKVSFSESVVNLTGDRDLISDLLERGILMQFPITLQERILQLLDDVGHKAGEIVSGKDAVAALVQEIEDLHFYVWSNRLHALTEEFLGFEARMNSVKQIEVRLNENMSAIRGGVKLKSRLDSIIESIEAQQQQFARQISEAAEHASQSSEAAIKAKTHEAKVSAALETVNGFNTTANSVLGEVNAKHAKVVELEERIRTFFAEIKSHRKEMEDTANAAHSSIEQVSTEFASVKTEYSALTQSLAEALRRKIQQADDLLRQATGASLFHSFSERQKELKGGKRIWLWTTLGLVLIVAAVGLYFAHELSQIKPNDVTWHFVVLRAIIVGPLVYGLLFCSAQYRKERRLEEEYAFKSAISLSLEPYRDFVRGIVKEEKDEERRAYTQFVTDLITKVFTSPVDLALESKEGELETETDEIRGVERIWKKVVKPMIDGYLIRK